MSKIMQSVLNLLNRANTWLQAQIFNAGTQYNGELIINGGNQIKFSGVTNNAYLGNYDNIGANFGFSTTGIIIFNMNTVTYAITTKNNILDDGSGNMKLLGNIATGNGGTAPTAVTVPASGVAYTPSTTINTILYVSGGTVTGIAINGVATGLTSGVFPMKANDTITFTYTTAPTVYQMSA